MKAKKTTNKERMLDATMQLIAKAGLVSFSMKQVTEKCQVSEALIYRHFQTKENLLLQCYRRVSEEILAMFETVKAPVLETEEECRRYLHDVWMTYVRFLMKSGYKALYYFAYRESKYYAPEADETREVPACFENAGKFIWQNEKDGNNMKRVQAYVIDLTGMFIRYMHRNKGTNFERSAERMWYLLWSGILSLSEHPEQE